MSCCETRIIQVGGAGGNTSVLTNNLDGSFTHNDGNGNLTIIPAPPGFHADGDTRIEFNESAGAAGGDRMDFFVDNINVGSVEILATGFTKWTLDGILDPLMFVGSPFDCPTATANVAAGQAGLYVSDGTDGFTLGTWVKVENGVCSTIGGASSVSIPLAATDPLTPVIGDIYYNTVEDSLYVYDGTVWQQPCCDAGAIVTAAVEPIGTAEGEVYYNTTDNTLYVFNGTIWEEVAGTSTADSIVTSATDPVGAVVGDVYYNTTNDILYSYDGTTWNPLGGTAGSVVTSATDPVGAVEGDVYYNTVDNILYTYDGTDWVAVDQFGIPSVATVAGTDFFGTAYIIGDNIVTYPGGVVSMTSVSGGISADAGQALTLGTDSLPLFVKDCGTPAIPAGGRSTITATGASGILAPDLGNDPSNQANVALGPVIGGEQLYTLTDILPTGGASIIISTAATNTIVPTTGALRVVFERQPASNQWFNISRAPQISANFDVNVSLVDGTFLDTTGNTTGVTSTDIGNGLQEIIIEYTIDTLLSFPIGISCILGPLPFGTYDAALTDSYNFGAVEFFDGVTSITTSTGSPAVPGVLDMTGATALLDGECGFVPTPQAGDEGKFLQGDGTWTAVAGGVDEVIENAGPLAGAAPAGAQWGVDTTTGQAYYVTAGNWTAVPTASVDLNTTISDETGANGTGLVVPTTVPPTNLVPDIGDMHIEVYDDVTLYFTAIATDWVAPAVVEITRGAVELKTTFGDEQGANGTTLTTPTTPPPSNLTPSVGDTHVELYDDVTLYFTATAANWTTPTVIEKSGGGGILEVISGGATIRYSDDSGTPPTFTSVAGAGTLVPNGNMILSLDFTEDSGGSGSFVLTHNNGNNPDVRQFLVSTGTTSFYNTALTANNSVITVNGLNSSQAQVFAFKF